MALMILTFLYFTDHLTKSDNVDVIVAIQPVISDGRLAPVLAQQWNNPLILWATPEEQTGEMISGNSLVRKSVLESTLVMGTS